MEQNKMTPALKVFLNNPLSVLPGHTIKWDDLVETPVGIILKGGGTEGRDRQEKTALDIITAYNNTYGAGINPEGLPTLIKAALDLLAYDKKEGVFDDCQNNGDGFSPDLLVSSQLRTILDSIKAAIEKATIKP
jgi:hypothetical protein